MVRIVILLIGLFFAQYSFSEQPIGYLWYNLPKPKIPVKKKQIQGVPFKSLTYRQQDAVLAYYTKEAWHKAMNQQTVSNMKNYLALQHYWTERATQTSRLFEKTMLYYPQYHYETSHPTNAVGVKISDALQTQKENIAIKSLAKTHGLFYFYRGANPYDQKQSPIIDYFAKNYGMTVIPISVDGVSDPVFPNSRNDSGQSKKLNIRFFPALILVNPKTGRTQPVSYGLVTQDTLARQFLLVATDFAKGDL